MRLGHAVRHACIPALDRVHYRMQAYRLQYQSVSLILLCVHGACVQCVHAGACVCVYGRARVFVRVNMFVCVAASAGGGQKHERRVYVKKEEGKKSRQSEISSCVFPLGNVCRMDLSDCSRARASVRVFVCMRMRVTLHMHFASLQVNFYACSGRTYLLFLSHEDE